MFILNFILFNCFIIFLLIIDYLIVSKNNSIKASLILTIGWIILGLAFSLYIYKIKNFELMIEYLGAYFIEKSLSIDNIFVFFLIFSKFNIKPKYQHKILFIGIWSALILRFLMIFVVGNLIESFHFMIILFGILLIYTGIQSLIENQKNSKPFYNKIMEKLDIEFYKNHKGNFFIRDNKKLKPTILVIALITIETSDIIFAFDSIPAVFSVTSDLMIAYTSNAFAIIGLRSLYGFLAPVIQKIEYIKYGISLILCFIGFKMTFSNFISISAITSSLIIITILILSFIFSMYKRKIS